MRSVRAGKGRSSLHYCKDDRFGQTRELSSAWFQKSGRREMPTRIPRWSLPRWLLLSRPYLDLMSQGVSSKKTSVGHITSTSPSHSPNLNPALFSVLVLMRRTHVTNSKHVCSTREEVGFPLSAPPLISLYLLYFYIIFCYLCDF